MTYNINKALILAGGSGTRLRPLTTVTTKQLLPVANRPILFYILDLVKKAGIKSAAIIVSPEWGNQVKQAVGNGSQWDMAIEYFVQEKPKGLADTIKIARSFLKNEPFLMILGDNVYHIDIEQFMRTFSKDLPDAMILLGETKTPQKCGIAVMSENGQIIGVEEKPAYPKSNLAIAGIYLFKSKIHEAVDIIVPSKRGELEITDAIQILISQGQKVYGYKLDGWWLDTGNKDNLLDANKAVLNEMTLSQLCSLPGNNCTIIGNMVAGKDTTLDNCTIVGPVSVSSNCIIKDSTIGPYVSIGDCSVVESSSIKDSIIFSNASVKGVTNLQRSVIGNNVVVTSCDDETNIVANDYTYVRVKK